MLSRTRMRAAAALTLGVLLAGLPAAARADVEPNDLITQAEQIVASPVTGTIASANDRDWYSFYVSGQQQLEITLSRVGANTGCSFTASFHDADVTYLTESATAWSGSAVIRYSTPAGVNRFYLRPNMCAGERYSITIGPGSAIVPGEGIVPVTPAAEPNESQAQATGPLSGGVMYSGATDTVNDVDWYFFYTLGPAAIDIPIINPGAGGCSLSGELFDDDEYLTSARAWSEQIAHLRYSLPSAGRWLIRIGTCQGQAYQFRLLPPEVFSLTPPPPPPPVQQPQVDTRVLPTVSSTTGSARVRGGKVRLQISGRLSVPAGVDPAQACGGTVTLTIKKGKTLLSARTATLTRSCRFSKTVNLSRGKVGRASSLKVTARFQGNGAMKARSKTFSVRVRR